MPQKLRPPAVCLAACIRHTELSSSAHPLSADELAHAGRLRQAADRDRYLTGRLLARFALSTAVGDRAPPSAWRFSTDRFGKPRAAHPLCDVHFNLAHAAGTVVVVTDTARPVGIDIERLDGARAIDLPALALSERERETLGKWPADMRGREFLKLWTLKEAIAKRSGEGVGLDFAALEPDWCPGSAARQRIRLGEVVLETRTVAMPDGAYQVSVAAAAETPAMVWNRVDLLRMPAPARS